MRCAEGVLTEGKVGSFPSFCSQLLDMASEHRVVPICPGTDGPSQAPSSPLGSMGEQGLTITTHQAHSRVLEKKKKKGCSRVQPRSLHRTSHPLSPWRTQDGPQAESCLARALKGLTLCFLEHETPHNSFQLLPDLWTGCVF